MDRCTWLITTNTLVRCKSSVIQRCVLVSRFLYFPVSSFPSIMKWSGSTRLVRTRFVYRQRGTVDQAAKDGGRASTLFLCACRCFPITKDGCFFEINRYTIGIRRSGLMFRTISFYIREWDGGMFLRSDPCGSTIFVLTGPPAIRYSVRTVFHYQWRVFLLAFIFRLTSERSFLRCYSKW